MEEEADKCFKAGMLLSRQGKFGAALAEFRQVSTLNPTISTQLRQ
jgi:hypothetical protein